MRARRKIWALSFPWDGGRSGSSQPAKERRDEPYDQKLAVNPSGLLVYHPQWETGITARKLTTEFLTELLEAFLVVALLAQTRLVSFAVASPL
jgi:hypothetical protein